MSGILHKFAFRAIVQVVLVALVLSVVPLLALVGVHYHGVFLGAMVVSAIYAFAGWSVLAVYSGIARKLLGLDTSNTEGLNTAIFYLYSALFLQAIVAVPGNTVTIDGLVSCLLGALILVFVTVLSFFRADAGSGVPSANTEKVVSQQSRGANRRQLICDKHGLGDLTCQQMPARCENCLLETACCGFKLCENCSRKLGQCMKCRVVV